MMNKCCLPLKMDACMRISYPPNDFKRTNFRKCDLLRLENQNRNIKYRTEKGQSQHACWLTCCSTLFRLRRLFFFIQAKWNSTMHTLSEIEHFLTFFHIFFSRETEWRKKICVFCMSINRMMRTWSNTFNLFAVIFLYISLTFTTSFCLRVCAVFNFLIFSLFCHRHKCVIHYYKSNFFILHLQHFLNVLNNVTIFPVTWTEMAFSASTLYSVFSLVNGLAELLFISNKPALSKIHVYRK